MLGTEVVLCLSSRVVGDRAFFVTNDGMVLVAERVDTSAAVGYVQERVDVMGDHDPSSPWDNDTSSGDRM